MASGDKARTNSVGRAFLLGLTSNNFAHQNRFLTLTAFHPLTHLLSSIPLSSSLSTETSP